MRLRELLGIVEGLRKMHREWSEESRRIDCIVTQTEIDNVGIYADKLFAAVPGLDDEIRLVRKPRKA